MISGSPAIVEYMDTFLTELPLHLDRIMEDITTFARTDLRTTARRTQEWAKYADMLDVEFDDDGALLYTLHADPATTDVIMELEFGGDGAIPQPLLRVAANRQAPIISRMLSQQMSKEVPGAQSR